MKGRNPGCGKCRWFGEYEIKFYDGFCSNPLCVRVDENYHWKGGALGVKSTPSPSELNSDGQCPYWEAKDEVKDT